MRDSVKKFFNGPGQCTYKEVVLTEDFIKDLKDKLEFYISVVGHEPLGLTLDSNLDRIDWYKDFILKNENSC